MKLKRPSYMSVLRAIPASAVLSCALAGQTFLSAGEAAPPPPKPVTTAPEALASRIDAHDLDYVSPAPATKFPWAGKPPVAPKKPDPPKDAANGQSSTAPDNGLTMNGEIIFRALGPFTRVEKTIETPTGPVVKVHMNMTKNVEIEMLANGSVLRGENVVIVSDKESGDTELLDAKGDVEIVQPDQTGKGQLMRMEQQFGPNHDLIKSHSTLVGDTAKSIKATMWLRKDPNDPSKVDVIEGMRMERDEIEQKFRVTGGPNAIITPLDPTAPADPQKAGTDASQANKTPAKPATAPKPPASGSSGGGGGVANLNLSGPGRQNLRCDGELNFDGITGKMRLTRNVVLIKEGEAPGEGSKICSDEAIITLDVPPPSATPAAGGAASALTGEMKLMECFGRVEIKTGTDTILCDKFTMDNVANTALMEMKNPADVVNVYNWKMPEGGDVMIVPKSLKMNMTTSEMEPGGPMKQRTFAAPPGSNRGNGPKPEDVKPLPDPKAKPTPNDPNAKASPKPGAK
ncbi:MAG TPA: hypothetical protein VKX17_17715 [Planctomycetota bacterium]|nr:hypothetical protein [Planctomycetota bacterium]